MYMSGFESGFILCSVKSTTSKLNRTFMIVQECELTFIKKL